MTYRLKDLTVSAQCQQSPAKKPWQLGPYSKVLRRGAIGKSVDGRSTEGRYMRDIERQLTEHIGRPPSAPERLLIARVARTSLRILLLEEKLDAGNWTDLDNRTLSGLQNAFTGMLRALGLEAPPPEKSVTELLAAARSGGIR